MIPFRQIRRAMVEGLSDHLNLKVIEMNDIGKVPPAPFLTYDFTDLGRPENGGLPIVTLEVNLTKSQETSLFGVSFLSYANSKAESIENALKARDWFLTNGRVQLSETVGVVVVEVGEVTNRDVRIGLEWERRQGFDVDFRTMNIVETTAETIEKASIKEMSST